MAQKDHLLTHFNAANDIYATTVFRKLYVMLYKINKCYYRVFQRT